MRILVDAYKIECFENEQDYQSWLRDHHTDPQLVKNTVYHGAYYGIPKQIKDLFRENVLVSIKRLCIDDTQFILIHK